MGICASDWSDEDGGITTPYGTLHDDEGRQTGSAVTGVGNHAYGGSNGAQSCAVACAGGRNPDDPNDPCVNCGGYGDGLNCYTVLHAPADTVIRFTFTSLNLEGTTNTQYGGTGQTPCGTTCNDPRGCDFVSIYDGPDANSPLLGTFSGNPSVGPSVVTSQEFMYLQFETDNGNCGVAGAVDPGFFGDWEFVEQGEDICHPSAAVLHASHGVLHDDDPSDGVVVPGENTYQSGYGESTEQSEPTGACYCPASCVLRPASRCMLQCLRITLADCPVALTCVTNCVRTQATTWTAVCASGLGRGRL
jgi:hypothetical protein